MRLGDLCGGETERLTAADGLMIDYIDISSVSNESKSIIGKQTLQRREAPSRAQRIIKANDILVSTVRPNLNAVAVYDGSFENLAVASTGFCVLRCKPRVSHRFVFNICKSSAFIKAMTEQATGASYPAVNDKIIRAFEVPDLDYESQTQLAERMDSIQLIINLRKQQLCELDDLIKARFVEMFGDLRSNPKGWPVYCFEEITEIITDGEHATPRRADQGIYLLSARNVLDHALRLDDVDFIDQEEYDRIAKRIIPQAGDVLISCSGSVGRCCTVPEGLKFQMVRSTALLRFKSAILPVYAEYMITSDDLQQQINSAKTASSQANLFQGKIAKLRGFVPPLELQEQFAAFVSQVDKSKVVVQEALDKAQLLFDSLMQEYFG